MTIYLSGGLKARLLFAESGAPISGTPRSAPSVRGRAVRAAEMAGRERAPPGPGAKHTVLTSHTSGLLTRVSVELACMEAGGFARGSTRRVGGGGLSARGTPVLGRRSDALAEGHQSAQSTPVTRRREPPTAAASPAPSPAHRMYLQNRDESDVCSLENVVISGWLKFRDNKRFVVTALDAARAAVVPSRARVFHFIRRGPALAHVRGGPRLASRADAWRDRWELAYDLFLR
ncbi:hypothetical protein EVAR_78365_1 [Eumeta japonica]|uniref:Uncharacterized protein n=1 Tax=Eumeta variegata TaxID=151549 RepID=A0A4C1T491_EUMVA|nr:hypothetical protein EVAR_78365_1 [Eumeta japonica]